MENVNFNIKRYFSPYLSKQWTTIELETKYLLLKVKNINKISDN